MASSSGTSLEQRRWLVVGIALQNVLTPCLRDMIQTEMTPFYKHLVRNFGLDKQTYAAYQKTIPPSTVKLNYGSIHNNAALHRSPRHYDYCVKDEVSLAKLFMKPFMAHFNAFDSSFDASAALAVLCGAPPFTAVKAFAENVRSKVRNEWAHCDFAAWTEAHYHTCFDLMKALVKNLGFPPGDKVRLLDRLALWRNQGLDICLGKPLDDALLHVIHNEVQTLSHSLDDYRGKQDKDLESVCCTLALFKSEFHRSKVSLEEEQSNLKETCQDLKYKQDKMKEEMIAKEKEQKKLLRTSELLKMRQEQGESLCKELEVKWTDMRRELDVMRTKINTLSFPEDSKEVVFDAPGHNRWFTGRDKEVVFLEKCLPLKSGNGLKMGAICGLGGCGKTTLATHFAWKRKSEYDGGVFWVSMEDDRKFENSMNDLALRLGVLADSFDLTLSKVLNCISQRKKAWLLVLDDADQLNLSDQMRKVLSGRWKRQATGHLLLTTRREPKEVCGSIDLEPSCCLEIFSFSKDEAKKFILTRSGICDDAGQEKMLDELVQELGCLPLALEQAAAHIKALQFPISIYLEQYKSQRVKLLGQHPAKPLWEYESQSRLAVHTTWLVNFEYVKNSPLGEVTSTFVGACAFLAPHEIEEELINGKLRPVESLSTHSTEFSILKNQIMETLTKFSLFQRKNATSLSLHRLVQEVIRNGMSSNEEIASSLLTAVRLLHHSFQGCPSPDQILRAVAGSVQEQASASVADLSQFYLWSKLTSHASELQYHIKSLLDKQDIEREVKTVVLTRETSRVVYENSVKLSVQGHHEEAKEAERFAFQILDSGSSECVPLSCDELRHIFPHTIPLPQVLQKIILYSSQPPIDNQKVAMFENLSQDADIDAIRLQGNAFFRKDCFKEAVDIYTKAIKASKATERVDPRLLNNRATAYLKRGMFEECLQDSEEYINMMPNCWKGYSRKALALNGLGRNQPALCFAAIAFYHDTNCCRRYETFINEFKALDRNWKVVDSSETLKDALNSEMKKKVLLMQNGQYEIQSFKEADPILDTNISALENVSSVTIKSESLELDRNCCFQSINFETEQGVDVTICANVEFERCEFYCNSVKEPAVTVNGTATFVECKIRDSKGGGIVVKGYASFASLRKCYISGNGNKPLHSSGINVFDHGNLAVHECLVHGNTEGINIGTPFSSLAKEVVVTDSEIYEGVIVAGDSHLFLVTVTIKRNKIYHNGGYGFRVSFLMNTDNNVLLFQGNTVFENFWWGVWVQCNSGGQYKENKICNNKMGGIRVGKRSPGMPACVVENNIIHDNCGPAFHEGLRHFEGYSFPVELASQILQKTISKQLSGIGWTDGQEISLPNTVSAELTRNECFQNEKGRTKRQTNASATNCAFCFRTGCQLKSCKRCMTARYCGKKCQKMHWGRHKYLCQAAGEISAIEVSIPVCRPGFITVAYSSTYPGLEPTGPDYASPPPRDGSRFIVKLQTFEGLLNAQTLDSRGYVSDDYNPNKASIALYDRSRHVDFFFAGRPRIFHLIMECGMMGTSMYLSKKLFCWAAFKDGKTIRIFTHEFPPVQKW